MANYENFNYSRLKDMNDIHRVSDEQLGEVIVYKSTEKSYVVEYEDHDVIVTVSLKQHRFEAQRTYKSLEKITGAETKEYRLFAQNTLYDCVDTSNIVATTKTKSTKKNVDTQLLEFLANKYEFNIDDEKVAYEQSLKQDQQTEIEKKIAQMQAELLALQS